MDDPVKQIEGVVRSLTQGSPNEQAAAVNRYFTPNAEFVHPFCRVPPFQNVSVPLLGETNSRQLLLAVLRWYRILSPRIDLRVNSVQFDSATDKLYLDINQRFAFWFVPFMVSNVNLVTRLSLVKTTGSSAHRQLTNGNNHDHGQQHDLVQEIQDGELPSFAEVAAASAQRQPLLSSLSSTEPNSSSSSGGSGQYLIAKQEDLYQVNEFVKFLVPFGIGDALVSLWQLFATAMSLAGSLVLFPFVWVLTHGGDGGSVKPPVERVEDDGRVVFRGVGAEWASRTLSPLSSLGSTAVQGVVVNAQENATILAEKGEALASNVQQRARKAIHDVQAREEALVRAAQQKTTDFSNKATDLAGDVQQGAESLVRNAQTKGERLFEAAQTKEREIVRGAQAKEEKLVGNMQAREERAAENTRQWWAANKTVSS